MKKIIRIDSARHMDGESWELGEETEYKSGKFITEIKDMGIDFEDSIHVQFDICVDGQLWKSLINMPVQVEYELDSDPT